MKILYVTTISNTVNAFLIPHIKMLIEKGYKVDVAFNLVQDLDPLLVKLGCKVHKLEFNRSPIKRQNFTAYKKLKKIIQEEQYDLVHTHTPIASAIVRLACRGVKDVKVIYTAHGFHFYKGASLLNWLIYYPLERLLSKFTDCLITINSEDYSRALNHKFKAEVIEHVHGVGIDIDRFKPIDENSKLRRKMQYGFKENDFLMFYAAEFNKNKNQQLLIKVLNSLREEVPNARLLLAGNGELMNSCKVLSEELGVSKWVHFLGFRSDLEEIIPGCDIVVGSSLREGLPVNIMEAMACGLPVVAIKNRGHSELVKNDINGWIIEEEDVNEIVSKIKMVAQNYPLKDRLGKSGRSIIEKLYAIDKILDEMNKIYTTQINRKENKV